MAEVWMKQSFYDGLMGKRDISGRSLDEAVFL